MKIYLAATYSSKLDMRTVRDKILQLGHSITSRWIDLEVDECPNSGMNSGPQLYENHAYEDLADVRTADAVVLFADGKGRGGRHTEFGYALGLGKELIVVGPRENVFHCLPFVSVLSTTDDLYRLLSTR